MQPYYHDGDGKRLVNPDHRLRASDVLEIGCPSDALTKVEGIEEFLENGDPGEANQKLVSAQLARLTIGTIADFPRLKIYCDGSEIANVPICSSDRVLTCATEIGHSTWGEFSDRFSDSGVKINLLPRHDPVLYPNDRVILTRSISFENNDDETDGPAYGVFELDVSKGGILSLPPSRVTKPISDPWSDEIDESLYREWSAGVSSGMFNTPVSPSGVCEPNLPTASVVASCLSAGWKRSSIDNPKRYRTPWMRSRLRQCRALGIDEQLLPTVVAGTFIRYDFALERNDFTLVAEDGDRIEIPLEDGASLRLTVQEAYRRIAGRELLDVDTLTKQIAFLTVIPRRELCAQHAAPFFIKTTPSSDARMRPIRLLRGDTVIVSRTRPGRLFWAQ